MKFIVLPGYLQGGKTFAEKSSAIRKLLTKSNHELDYVDPPKVLASYKDLEFKLGESDQESQEKWDQIVEKNNNRCWWRHSEENPYEGFKELYEHMVNYIEKNGPYDGIIGFSQGAAMLLVLLLKFDFKLCMTFSGFCFTVPKSGEDGTTMNYTIEDLEVYQDKVKLREDYADYFRGNTRILNIFGNNDMIVPNIRSKYVSKVFDNVENFEFEGGHMMPSKKPFLRPIVDIVNSL